MSRNLQAFLKTLGFGEPQQLCVKAIRSEGDEHDYVHEGLALQMRKPAHWRFVNRWEWNDQWADIKYRTFADLSEDELKSYSVSHLYS